MKEIIVYAGWNELVEPRVMGRLLSTQTRGQEILAFEYDPEWLREGDLYHFDPALQQFPGIQYPSSEQPNFGMFLDSSPDRWGRFLQDRREAQLARLEGRSPRKLQPTDYLLGVHDLQRAGGIRFKVDASGEFLAGSSTMTVPPWTELVELEHAVRELERHPPTGDETYSKWIAMLVAPGGSLGGARPKAGVVDANGQLWIAKFPARMDISDVGAWEFVAHKLAAEAGIVTATSIARRFHSRHHSFLTQRFDRKITGERTHFASAMTLLGRSDGDDASSGASYLEIAEVLIRYGARPNEDLSQLWRRIVFNICISNTDDHLRNHGFLLDPSGWRLSPAYDMNPVPGSAGLKLLISDSDNSLDLDLALEVAPFFRLEAQEANLILNQVLRAVRKWRAVAQAVGLAAEEIAEMVPAFQDIEGPPYL